MAGPRALGAVMVIRTMVVAGVVGLGVAISSDPNGEKAIAVCVAVERSGYPPLKAVAAHTMPASAIIRISDKGGFGCEDSLMPALGARAIMREWHTRHEGNSYLQRQGWRFYGNGGYLASPDGTVYASTSRGTVVNGKPHVEVLFGPKQP